MTDYIYKIDFLIHTVEAIGKKIKFELFCKSN